MSDEDEFPVGEGPARGWAVVRLLTGGAAGAAVLTLLQVPAGALVGAVIGSAIANRVRLGGAAGTLPVPVRVSGLVLLGSVAGVRLEASTLVTLTRIAAPLAGAVLTLLLLNAALALVLVRRYGIDSRTAVLACAPGGISEIAVAAEQLGARTGVVIAVHAVRVLAVVLVVLPLLVVLLARG